MNERILGWAAKNRSSISNKNLSWTLIDTVGKYFQKTKNSTVSHLHSLK